MHSLKNQFTSAVLSTSSLATLFLSLGTSNAQAQIIIQSTGRLSGTIELPKFNPNYNKVLTRVDTDPTGAYYRNGTLLYKSDYVKVQTRPDGSLHYFVDFKGIPVVSFDGVLTSPVLSGGELTPYSYQGKLPGTKFQAVVQDEFGLKRAFYTGIVTDPKTGQQYQGTFEVNGQGPRYSDKNGSETPTVFDYKSDVPGTPTVKSMTMSNAPMVKLNIQVPANATPITPGGGTVTPTPIPVTGGSGTVTPTPIPVTGGGGTVTPTPTPVTGSGTVAPNPISASSINNSGFSETVSSQLTSNSTSSPSVDSNMEFSGGNISVASLDPSTLARAGCSLDAVNCRALPKAIGPRSRVLLK
jgi:hypothetical protein